MQTQLDAWPSNMPAIPWISQLMRHAINRRNRVGVDD